ncbi:MAG: 4-hydroxy-tetrahydrodipicolinate reductase [Rhodospirillales bacterium]|jgi:4-hydroxy-tetrahydrodipicolinate reductase|nr:4-hydroxy-tetrahydrodipicolinate reductase [Rhodospirillales bacterium]MDP6805562.1 4-hydroxy-tetrahydrodipicolinate reductase [Rhodospirillales bacterium]
MKIGVVGCGGRMGRMIVSTIATTEGCEIAGGTEPPLSPLLGQDVGAQAGLAPAGLVVGDDAQALFRAADVVVDFTAPDATALHARLAAEMSVPLVAGTTGLTADEQKAVEDAARSVAIVQAANMSVGINLLLGLTEETAAKFGDDYDIEILEMHHRHKVDAPSGTALALGRAAAKGRGVELDAVAQRVRDGHTGPRRAGDIGFATMRGGDVAGEHTVVFATEASRIEIVHRAISRAVFAGGALRAALWLDGKPPGLYSMRDVLGLG